MARYTGPITKKSRRLKVDLIGGDKSFEARPFPPGEHGRHRVQEKEYLHQLQEKQKARFTYGVMEKQFRRYYAEAAGRRGRPVRFCCRSSSPVSTMSSTAPDWPRPVARPARS